MHAGQGELVEALEACERALTHLEAVDAMPFEQARTLLVRGRIERRMKRRGTARATLQRALDAFSSLGAGIWEKRTADELARIGERGREQLK